MKIEDVLARIKDCGVVAVVRGIPLEALPDTVAAVVEGGISCVEVTMSVRGALRDLTSLKDQWGDRLMLGAGEVLNAAMVELAAAAGADFCSGVGAAPEMVEACHERDLLGIPGALTPTEILAAWHAGAALVNIFPSDALGITYFRTVRRALSHVELMPSGGISTRNAGEFLRAGAAALAAGIAVVNPEDVARGRFDGVTGNARAMRRAVLAAREP